MFKLPFLAFVLGIVISTSVTCDVCDDPNNPPTPENKVAAAGAAPQPEAVAIPRG